MRFLQLVMSAARRAGPPDPGTRSVPADPNHVVAVNRSIAASIASGSLLATGWVGKRATAAARVTVADGVVTVEDPPADAPGTWMAAGGFSLVAFPTKAEAIASAADKLAGMGGGVVELIEVGELHPPPAAPAAPRPVGLPAGVVPCLAIDGASDAALFYLRALRAREVARQVGDDGRVRVRLEVNGGALVIADPVPERDGARVGRPPSDTMQLFVGAGEGQAWWDRAIAAGCAAVRPFGPGPGGGADYGELCDPYGVTWAIDASAG